MLRSTERGGTTYHVVRHGGRWREYWLHRPCCADDNPPGGTPLVVMLHGWNERGSYYAGLDGHWSDRWVAESERGCFIVAWPQGVQERARDGKSRTSWNAGGCSSAGAGLCTVADVQPPVCMPQLCADPQACEPCAWCGCADDVGYVEFLARRLRDSDLGIDAARLFVAGCSNGGMLAFDLAMRSPSGLFAAFVTNCGLPHAGLACVPPTPRALIHIHATNDLTIRTDGGPSDDGGWRYETVDHALGALQASNDACRSVAADWRPLSLLAEADEETLTPTLRWLRNLSLPEAVAPLGEQNESLAAGRCRLRATCEGGEDLVQCTGEFGHDWPEWAAAVAWRFFEHAAEATHRGDDVWIGNGRQSTQWERCAPRGGGGGGGGDDGGAEGEVRIAGDLPPTAEDDLAPKDWAEWERATLVGASDINQRHYKRKHKHALRDAECLPLVASASDDGGASGLAGMEGAVAGALAGGVATLLIGCVLIVCWLRRRGGGRRGGKPAGRAGTRTNSGRGGQFGGAAELVATGLSAAEARARSKEERPRAALIGGASGARRPRSDEPVGEEAGIESGVEPVLVE